MRTKLLRVLTVAALLVSVGGADIASRATAAPGPISLALGRAAFWSGGYVESADVDLPGAAACEVETCFSYPLHVAAGGWRLRVAIDTPDRANEFELDLIDPSGAQVASASNAAQ